MVPNKVSDHSSNNSFLHNSKEAFNNKEVLNNSDHNKGVLHLGFSLDQDHKMVDLEVSNKADSEVSNK
mgnify:CR=1 FL=1